jgi:uncharacterized protein
MQMRTPGRCVAFAGQRLVAAGELAEVALAVKRDLGAGENPALIFDEATSELVWLDLRGSEAELLRRLESGARAAPQAPQPTGRGPGRPRLGVVAREVTLLPRHWDWLSAQPGGASVALRKLVDAARRSGEASDRTRRAREAAYRFMTTVAGNEPGYEEAIRALFAGDLARFQAETGAWSQDVRDHLMRLAHPSFEAQAVSDAAPGDGS